jgi:hypothetical protein
MGYDAGAWFSIGELPVDGLGGLAVALDRFSRDPRVFVVRGEPLPCVDRRRARRLLHERHDGTPPTLREVPRRWLLLDFDSVDEPRWWDWRDGPLSALSLRAKLPGEFQRSSFWWQFTGGAGFKPGLRMRLAFWLSRPATGDELGRWLAAAPVDHALFRAVQPIYVARPILRGVADPVPERGGLEADLRDEVEVPELGPAEPARPAATVRAENLRRLRSMPAAGYGWPFAVLREAAEAVAGTPPAGLNRWNGPGRHHALYCAALRVSRPVAEGRLDAAGAVRVLAAAARAAGIAGDGEIARTIRNGFRAGGLPA